MKKHDFLINLGAVIIIMAFIAFWVWFIFGKPAPLPSYCPIEQSSCEQ